MTPSGPLQHLPSSPKASDPDDRIEQAVKARNDLRRGVLPLLDEQTEIARARAVIRRQEFEGVKKAHRPILNQFMRDTLAEFRRERGPRFGDSFGAHYLVSLIAHRRFDEYLELHGIRPSEGGDGAVNGKPSDGEPA